MIMRLVKRADNQHKIFLPKMVIENMGRYFYMEVYEDKVVLIPIKKGE